MEVGNEVRRLSTLIGVQDDEDAKYKGTPLDTAFEQMVKRLKSDRVQDPEAVQVITRLWRREYFDRFDEREQLKKYRQLLDDVLPTLLADHVKKSKGAEDKDKMKILRAVRLTPDPRLPGVERFGLQLSNASPPCIRVFSSGVSYLGRHCFGCALPRTPIR